MGKVYEALEKAEKERDRAPLHPFNGAGSTDGGDTASSQRPEPFSFIQYSLNAAAEAKQATDEASVMPEAGVMPLDGDLRFKPSREVAIEIGRIDPHLVSIYDFDPRASEEYRNLAITLISAAEESPFKRLLITSAQHREGRSCVTLNLACELARANKRTLVVDGDFQRPSALRLLGLESETGLAEALGRNQPPTAALIRVLPCDFDLLPTRSPIENSAQLITSPAFRRMLMQLDPAYDFVLFDSPPLTAAASSLLARLTHKTLLVIEAGRTGSSQMAKALAPISRDSVVGVVINRNEH